MCIARIRLGGGAGGGGTEFSINPSDVAAGLIHVVLCGMPSTPHFFVRISELRGHVMSLANNDR